jgi:hypothetical protein
MPGHRRLVAIASGSLFKLGGSLKGSSGLLFRSQTLTNVWG